MSARAGHLLQQLVDLVEQDGSAELRNAINQVKSGGGFEEAFGLKAKR